MKMGIIRVTLIALFSATTSFYIGRVYEYTQTIDQRTVYEGVNEISMAMAESGLPVYEENFK